jgi:hypothetical protein
MLPPLGNRQRLSGHLVSDSGRGNPAKLSAESHWPAWPSPRPGKTQPFPRSVAFPERRGEAGMLGSFDAFAHRCNNSPPRGN